MFTLLIVNSLYVVYTDSGQKPSDVIPDNKLQNEFLRTQSVVKIFKVASGDVYRQKGDKLKCVRVGEFYDSGKLSVTE